MNLNKTRVVRIIIITVIVLIMLLVGQWLYTKYFAEKSLENTLLKNNYVDNVNVIKEGKEFKIQIKLKNISNIKTVYNDLYDIISNHLKNESFSVEILNKPCETIEYLYEDKVQFIIYEALQTGHFTQMKATLDKIQAKHGIDIKVFLDSNNIYLQMQYDKSALYKIIERNLRGN